MPGRKPAKIELSEKVCQELEKLAARHTTGQQEAQRARIILKAAEGKNHIEIARELKVSIDMTALWREHWLALSAIGLEDLSVGRASRGFTTTRRAVSTECRPSVQIEQMACEAPEKAGRPISQWTGQEIADEMVKRGIVEYISRRHATRLLKKGNSNRT
ncbi:MAG: COG3415 family protein [Aggregatilineales bacterium]